MERRHGEIKPFEIVVVIIVLTLMAVSAISILAAILS